MKGKILRLEAYPCYIAVLVGKGNLSTKLKQLGQRLTQHEIEVELALDERDGAFVVELEKMYRPNKGQRAKDWRAGHLYVLWLPSKPRTVRDLQLMAHECIHLKNYILKYMGQKRLSLTDDEVEANMYDFIFAKILTTARGL